MYVCIYVTTCTCMCIFSEISLNSVYIMYITKVLGPMPACMYQYYNVCNTTLYSMIHSIVSFLDINCHYTAYSIR